MYRDNSLMPKEAIRLAALGILIQHGTCRYADLAALVRHFTSRIVGPSLDLMGTSLEMLRFEGLIAAEEGTGMEDNACLAVTPAGRSAFDQLMQAHVRTPASDPFNKLVIALKLRFLHLLDRPGQIEQADALAGLAETERARLADLAAHHAETPGLFAEWLRHDLAQIGASLDWFRALRERL